ncbi:MAG: hypothetical protein ACRCZF_18290 [Gemmataceae bacterium]
MNAIAGVDRDILDDEDCSFEIVNQKQVAKPMGAYEQFLANVITS